MAARPWSADDDTRLRELAGAGQSVGACAEALDRSRTATHRRAQKLGITFDREPVRAAVEARVLDAKARRTKLEVELLEDAERLRAQLFAPTVVFNFGGKDNTYEERTVDQPPHADKLKIMQAVGIAVDRSLKISTHDADTGVAEAVGALDQVEQAIAAAAAQLGPQDDGEDTP